MLSRQYLSEDEAEIISNKQNLKSTDSKELWKQNNRKQDKRQKKTYSSQIVRQNASSAYHPQLRLSIWGIGKSYWANPHMRAQICRDIKWSWTNPIFWWNRNGENKFQEFLAKHFILVV